MKIYIIYIFILGIPRVNINAADFLMKRPFRSACSMACYTCFPAYIELDRQLRKTRYCRACNGGNQVLAGVPPGVLAELPGVLPGVLAKLAGVLREVLRGVLRGVPPGVPAKI